MLDVASAWSLAADTAATNAGDRALASIAVGDIWLDDIIVKGEKVITDPDDDEDDEKD